MQGKTAGLKQTKFSLEISALAKIFMTDTLLGVVEKPFRMRVPNQHVSEGFK